MRLIDGERGAALRAHALLKGGLTETSDRFAQRFEALSSVKTFVRKDWLRPGEPRKFAMARSIAPDLSARISVHCNFNPRSLTRRNSGMGATFVL